MIGLTPPRVSVLMTVFNGGAYLRPAIESLLAQSYTDFELIIVDDGSTDGSVTVVESFTDPRIRLVRNATNRGQTACLNQGLALACGEFVARQDADDLSHPDRLEKQTRFLDAHPEIALLGANAEQIDESGRLLGHTDLPRDTPAIRWANLFDNSLLHSAVTFRAKVIREEFGGYDESYRCSQDYALWSLVARRHEVANLAEALISLRVHPESMMRSPASALEVETDRILRANLSAEFPGRSFSEEEIGVLAEYRHNLAPGSLRRFRALFDALRAAFLQAHPEAGKSREFARAEGLQFSRIGYNLLERDRFAALSAYAHCIRRYPRALVELPWPRIIALGLLGESARTLHRRIFLSKMNRPYRVLHVIDSLALGGAQVVLENLLTHADRSRFTLETVCLHGRGVFWDRIKATGSPVHSLSFHHYFPSYVPGLLGLMLARRYDVVHCHLLASNLVAKPIARLAGVPVRINHDHCNDKLADPRRWTPAADTWTNRFSTHICAVSESTRQFLIQHEGVPEERATTIHNGVDLAIFHPRPEQRAEARARWNLPADAFVVGGIGRLSYQKNFALFVETAAKVLEKHPSARFVIAGAGEDEAALRAQAAQLGIEGRLHFLGFVGDMTALYPALDLLLLTSRYEGLPITILEAMAVGIPIVAPRLDGMLEILRDREHAALVPPGDRDAFAARVCELIEQPALATRYADAALAKARAHHSAEAMTRAVEAIYLKYLTDQAGK